MKSLPSQEYLLSNLSYDPESGELRWRTKRKGRRLDRQAGCRDPMGYRRINIENQHYWVHRVIWKIMTGRDPKAFIDHKDNDKTNNRWDNLREATKTDNQRNCKNHITNKSGVKGVWWDRNYQKWRARISVNNRTHHIGSFDNFSDAVRARQLAAEQMHGAFARRE